MQKQHVTHTSRETSTLPGAQIGMYLFVIRGRVRRVRGAYPRTREREVCGRRPGTGFCCQRIFCSQRHVLRVRRRSAPFVFEEGDR